MGYYELVNVCNQILDKLNSLYDFLTLNLNNILYVLSFALVLYFGFKCIRGYRV